MAVTPQCIHEIMAELEMWRGKKCCNITELQSLIGKLQFLSKCIRPGRVFVARLLNFLRGMKKGIWYMVSDEVGSDIKWWYFTLPHFKGTALMWLYDDKEQDCSFATDSCLQGCGGVCEEEYFHVGLPEHIHKVATNIANTELLTVSIALRLWGHKPKGRRVRIWCDNEASVACINNGRARDIFMQQWLREICYLSTINKCWLKAVYLTSAENRIPDLLSHWEIDLTVRAQLIEYAQGKKLREVTVNHDHFIWWGKW